MLHDVLKLPIAHRGLHNLEKGVAENSLSAFRLAVEGNFAIECDLQLSSDNVPMVIHDDTIDRVTGKPGKICEMSAEQIADIALLGSTNDDHTLRFPQLLEEIKGHVALAVELKSQNDGRNAKLAEMAVRALQTYKGPLTFISFNPALLTEVRKYGFKGPLGIITERFDGEVAKSHLTPWQRFSMRHLLHYPRTRFDFVDCGHRSLDLPAVRLFRALGFPLAAWTIKSQQEADDALKQCDQIAFEGFIPTRD